MTRAIFQSSGVPLPASGLVTSEGEAEWLVTTPRGASFSTSSAFIFRSSAILSITK